MLQWASNKNVVHNNDIIRTKIKELLAKPYKAELSIRYDGDEDGGMIRFKIKKSGTSKLVFEVLPLGEETLIREVDMDIAFFHKSYKSDMIAMVNQLMIDAGFRRA